MQYPDNKESMLLMHVPKMALVNVREKLKRLNKVAVYTYCDVHVLVRRKYFI